MRSPFMYILASTDIHSIRNPLAELSRDDIAARVDDLTNRYNLHDHRDLLMKGALVAQNTTTFDQLSEISAEDKEALDREINQRWSHPKSLWLTVITCSIGAAVHGWDQVSMQSLGEEHARC